MRVGGVAPGRPRPAAGALLRHRAAAARDARRPGRRPRSAGWGRRSSTPSGSMSVQRCKPHSWRCTSSFSSSHRLNLNFDVMIKLSVNVNKVATLRNSRGGACAVGARGGRASASPPVRPGITVHPRADARHITAARRARDRRRCCATLGSRVGVQHRGRSAAGSADARPRGEADAVHAGAGAPGRDHQPGRLAAATLARRRWPASSAAARRRHPRQPVRRSGGRGRSAGPPASAPTASSCTPSRSPARSSAARRRRAASFDVYARAAELAHVARPRRQRRPRPRSRQPARCSALPHLDEVSIGHALVSHALFVGLDRERPRIPGASSDGAR